MAARSQKINVLAELERLGQEYKFTGSDEVRCKCPFHDDNSPSCSVNTQTSDFYCHVCKKGGDFVTLLSRILDRTRAIVYADLCTRYDLDDDKTVDPEVVEEYHARIWEAEPLLKELRARGVTDDMIRTRRFGEKDGRVIIPIKNKSGRYVNLRKYLPGASGADKMKNQKGRGKPRLYPIDQLTYERIALCGGEVKAVVAAGQLNRLNVGAIATTCGEGNWDAEFTEEFRNKEVWIVYDIDAEGVKAADKIAMFLAATAASVRIVRLPLDIEIYPTGDVNDFIATEGGDLWSVMESSPEWAQPDVADEIDESEEPLPVGLGMAFSHQVTKKRIRVEAVVSAIAESTYVIPKDIRPACDRQQDCCPRCRLYVSKREVFTIKSEDPALLEMIDATKHGLKSSIMASLGVPSTCASVEFGIEAYRQADDVRISPKLDILNRDTERTLQRAICVKDGLQLNENYALVGRQYPDPRSQSATLLVSEYEATGDALSHYVCDDASRLKKFQPADWTVDGIKAKLHEIYEDLEYNVTDIRQRRKLHMVMDLAWHSSLFVKFDGKVVKGNVEILVVGDSSQGKSETALRLMQHYGSGVKVDCKNATVAGLLGGVQQLSGRWFVSWGIIPTHDKRLVILEELKGANTKVIASLTDMRSSGVAEIPKIEKRRTAARTRLIALSNPRSDRPISSYSFGVEAVKELIGALEDVRRFDVCFIVARDEVEQAVVDKPRSEMPRVEHVYDSESCQELVLWCWTRTEDQVVFSQEAEKAVMQASSKLCEMFSSEIPIVDSASMRYKIARLSSALAGRTYSTDDGHVLIVRPSHVETVRDFLISTYSGKAFGYVDFTKAIKALSTMGDPASVEKQIRLTPHSAEFAESLLRTTKFDLQDVQDWCGSDRQEASVLVSTLVRKRAIVRDGRSYVKTPQFIELLKRLVEGGLTGEPPFMSSEKF